VIRSFRCKKTEALFNDKPVRDFHLFERVARRKLTEVETAVDLKDLSTPGNKLEKLKGDRQGQYSIRINDQYRICFTWTKGDAYDVEITDYH
jgi:toxin HigB-1